MVCYKLVTRCIPFEGHSTRDYDFILDGNRPKLPIDLHLMLKGIVVDCWHANLLKRPSFLDIIVKLNEFWVLYYEVLFDCFWSLVLVIVGLLVSIVFEKCAQTQGMVSGLHKRLIGWGICKVVLVACYDKVELEWIPESGSCLVVGFWSCFRFEFYLFPVFYQSLIGVGFVELLYCLEVG